MTTGVFWNDVYNGKEWDIIGNKFRNFPGAMSRQLKLPGVKLYIAEEVSAELLLKIKQTIRETDLVGARGSPDNFVAWDEAKVRVEATKRAASERALEELKVEIEGEGDRVTVRTRYPRPHWLGNAGSVEYRVSVPRSARVRVTNVNGRVEVGGVAGSVHAA